MGIARFAAVCVGWASLSGIVQVGCSGDSSSAATTPTNVTDAGTDASDAAPADAAPDAADADAAVAAEAGIDAAPPTCAAGMAVGADGTCQPFGIQGCAALFLGDDGLCHPTLEKCAPGSIPQFATGCVPVAIPGCAPAFLEADGLCHPSASKCPDGAIPVPTEGCVSIDPPGGCGAAPFGDVADGAGNVYVDASATAGGDGSKAKPFTTLSAGTSAVAAGGRVVLAAGTYAEGVFFQKSFDIVGRCASMVRLTGAIPVSNGSATLVQTTGTVAVQNLTVAGKSPGFLGVGGSMTLDHVRFDKVVGMAIYPAGGSLATSYVLVNDTATSKDPNLYGGGLRVVKAKTTFDKTAFVRNVGSSTAIGPGSTAAFTDVIIEGTVLYSDGLGVGLEIDDDAKVTMSGSALIDHIGRAAQVNGKASQLDLATSIVTGTKVGPAGVAWGLLVLGGGRMAVSDSALVHNEYEGFVASAAGSQGTLTRSWIDHTVRVGDGNAYGIETEKAASFALVDSTVSATDGVGVVISTQSTVTLDGALIERAASPVDSHLGIGVLVIDAAQASVKRSAIVDNSSVGALVQAAQLTVEGSVVERSQLDPDGRFGVGIFAEGSTLGVQGCLVSDNIVAGILATSQATVILDGTRIQNTKLGSVFFEDDPAPLTGLGDGLVADTSAVTITSSLAVGCARGGFVFAGASGSIGASAARDNVYGVVAQGDSQPTFGGGNDFSSNSAANTVADGSLAVPSGTVAVPTM